MRLPGGQGAALVLLLPLAACAKAPEVETTRTNEQGCTRLRSVGPQDPFQDPAPLKQACIGPYLLEIPQNYFYNQIGTEHDGSFSLALEYPSLEPFKPGERIGLTADVATRTVAIGYSYIDRIDVRQALRNAYTPMGSRQDDPAESFEGRSQGVPVHGLTPYSLDVERFLDYERGQGRREEVAARNARREKDWFVTRDQAGEVERIIKCTSREVTDSGVEYRDGKLVKSRNFGVAECDHYFIIPELSAAISIKYVREGLASWQRIEQCARDLLHTHRVPSDTALDRH